MRPAYPRRPPRWLPVALIVAIVAIWVCRFAWAKCGWTEELADVTLVSVTHDGVEQPLDPYQGYTHVIEADFDEVKLRITSESNQLAVEHFDEVPHHESFPDGRTVPDLPREPAVDGL